jgi:hypothetical protein
VDWASAVFDVLACESLLLSIPRPGRVGKVTDHELIASAVAQAATGICSDRQFLGVAGRLAPLFLAPARPDPAYDRPAMMGSARRARAAQFIERVRGHRVVHDIGVIVDVGLRRR